MKKYSVRYVHKIAPSDKDTGPDIELPDTAFAGPRELAKALRDARVLYRGASITSMRVEGDKTLAFPSNVGHWHCIVLTVAEFQKDASR